MEKDDIEEYLSERDWGHKLFSMHHCGQLAMKVVGINGVVQKFIDSATTSEAEKKSLADKKLADKKFRHLLIILTKHCNRNDLGALKTFIDILEDTNNAAMAHQLSLIYDERVNHFATLSLLSKEKSSVKNLENELSGLQRILGEKKRCLERLTAEKNELAIQNETFRKENLSLEKQKKKIEKDLLFVEEEMGEMTRTKNNLENEVKLKSNVIRERDKQIVEKEREVEEAIEKSNRLHIEIDTLKQQQSKAMVKDSEMSKKIEKLEDEIGEKENIITNLRKNNTMTRIEVEEELGNIMKGHAKKLDDHQAAMIQQQNEKFDDQMAMARQQNEKFDDQMAMTRQQNEKFDDQMAMTRQQNEKMDAIMRALNIQEKK